MSCTFVKTTQKNDLRVTLLWKYQLGAPRQAHIKQTEPELLGEKISHTATTISQPCSSWKASKTPSADGPWNCNSLSWIEKNHGFSDNTTSTAEVCLLSPSLPKPILSQRPKKRVHVEDVLSGRNKCQRKACWFLLSFNNTFPLLPTHHVDFVSCSRWVREPC